MITLQDQVLQHGISENLSSKLVHPMKKKDNDISSLHTQILQENECKTVTDSQHKHTHAHTPLKVYYTIQQCLSSTIQFSFKIIIIRVASS